MVTILSMTVRIDNVVDRGRYGGHMSTEITVRGSFAAFERPERGTVHATIAYDGPAPEPVYGRVARDLEGVKSSIGRLDDKENGAVTWWSADQLRTWSNRPWKKDGKQLPLVHHASVDLEVKFRDFSALSRWVGEHVANTEGFRVARVEWALTAKRREALEKDVRARAAIRGRARARPDSAGRDRRCRDARHPTGKRSPGGPHAGGRRRRSAGSRTRPRAHRGLGCGRRALRSRDLVTRPGVAFASWPNSKTSCVPI